MEFLGTVRIGQITGTTDLERPEAERKWPNSVEELRPADEHCIVSFKRSWLSFKPSHKVNVADAERL
jgi:hypothetical protein